jgi:hypothetical protein
LDTYEFKQKIVTYVKDEGFNLNNMTIIVKSILSCDVLGLKKIIQGTYLGHAFYLEATQRDLQNV